MLKQNGYIAHKFVLFHSTSWILRDEIAPVDVPQVLCLMTMVAKPEVIESVAF
jgi:hypothetical protein